MLNTKIPIIFLIVQVFASVLLTWSLISSDMLPMFYIAVIIILELVLMLLALLLDFASIKGKKKYVVILRRVVAIILSVVMLVASIFSCLAINKLGDTIMGITSKKTLTTTIGVYVLTNDPAEDLEDAEDYKFGYSEAFDGDSVKDALDDIKKEIGHKPDTHSYDSIVDMIQGLYDGEVDAIVLSQSYAAILSDQKEFSGFSSDTRLIYEYQAVSKMQHNNHKKSDGDLSTFIVYLSGSDTTSKMLDVSRSDVNILMAVNTKTKEIVLINTPRDYYVPISISSSGARDKLTHCGIYGIDCSMNTLADLYGYDIDYYAQINFTGFETLIDAIGGITIYSDVAFTNSHDNPLLDGSSLRINKGENFLNGVQALAFARERQSVSGGDNDRGKNQMKVIAAVVDKMSAGTVLSNYSEILNSLEGMFVTSMSADDINSLVKMQLSDMSSWNIHSYAVSGTPSSAITYSMPGAELYVTRPDQNTVDKASKLIDKVLSGKTVEDSDL